MLVDVLDAELERRDRPGVERGAQAIGEAAGDVERGYQVEFAGAVVMPALLLARELRREVGVEGAERVFVVIDHALAPSASGVSAKVGRRGVQRTVSCDTPA